MKPLATLISCYVALVSLPLAARATSPETGEIRSIDPPAGVQSMTPSMAVGRQKVYLSWLSLSPESDVSDRHVLRVASWDGSSWSVPRDVHRSDHFFANWADFPSLLVTPSGRLVVHWLEMAGDGTYDYDIQFAFSDDEGTSWSAPAKLHRDNVRSEHGFVSFVTRGDNGFAAVWLDGRQMVPDGGGANEMSLRFTEFDGRELGPETLLDARVCECCQTGMARTEDGLVVVYRDRSPGDIRDTSLVAFDGNSWTDPKTVYRDGWEIAGCPVNGPRVAAEGNRLAVAWFTAESDNPRVQVVFSSDGGKSFSKPVLLEKGSSMGRIDITALEKRSGKAGFAVSWLSRASDAHAGLRVAEVGVEGIRRQYTLGQTGTSRASGFPRMVRRGDELILAWTESFERGGASTVRTAIVSLENQDSH